MQCIVAMQITTERHPQPCHHPSPSASTNDQSLATYHDHNVAYHQNEAVITTQDQAMAPYQEEYEQYEEDQQYQATDQNLQVQGKGNK